MGFGGSGPLGGAEGAGDAEGAGGAVNPGSYDSISIADALIRTRNGVVDSWNETEAEFPHLKLDDPANMERWDPLVRASIFDFEIYSRLHFSDDGEDTATISHHYPDGDGTFRCRDLVELTRPPEATFRSQLKLLNKYAELRADRTPEILLPLGLPIAFLSSVTLLHPERTRWTLELLTAALRLAHFVAQRMKHALACRRPSELSSQVQPMIRVPSHGSLPSGHATEAFAVSAVLCELLRASHPMPARNESLRQEQIMRLANRITINRTIAGVHFPVDSVAGAMLGLTLGHYLAARAGAGSEERRKQTAWSFDGKAFPPERDFRWQKLYDVKTGAQTPDENHVCEGESFAIDSSPVLEWLWQKSVAELKSPIRALNDNRRRGDEMG